MLIENNYMKMKIICLILHTILIWNWKVLTIKEQVLWVIKIVIVIIKLALKSVVNDYEVSQ